MSSIQNPGGGGNPTRQDTSATGAQNNFDLTARYTHVICTGAAVVFGGFTVAGAAPQDGDVAIIDNGGSGTVRIETEGGSSTAANRATFPSARGQIVGARGRMLLVYDGGNSRWRGSLLEPGDYINVPYNSGDFAGSDSMVWAVGSSDLVTFAYQQRGRTLFPVLAVESSSISGTPAASLLAAIPAGFTCIDFSGTTVYDVGSSIDNGNIETTRTFCSANHFGFARSNGSNWSASSNNTRVYWATPIRIA